MDGPCEASCTLAQQATHSTRALMQQGSKLSADLQVPLNVRGCHGAASLGGLQGALRGDPVCLPRAVMLEDLNCLM